MLPHPILEVPVWWQQGCAPTLDIWAFPLPSAGAVELAWLWCPQAALGEALLSFLLLSCSLEESKESITKKCGGLEVFVCLVG